MSIPIFSFVPIAVVFAAISTTLPAFVEGIPIEEPSPPEGQLLIDAVPLVEGTPHEAPPLLEGDTLPEEAPKEWSVEDWLTEEWPIDESPIAESLVANMDHCRFVLETEESCYDWSGKGYIKIKLENCNPRSKDWIALYQASNGEVGKNEGPNYWGGSYDWEFTCGSRSCSYPVRYNYNYFTNWWQYLGNGNYKLPNGEYMIFLFANDGYYVKAASKPFTVQNRYDYCDKPPTQSPIAKPKCKDTKGTFRLRSGRRKKCKWARGRRKNKRCRCRLKKRGKKVRDVCPKTCDYCPTNAPTQAPSTSAYPSSLSGSSRHYLY